MASLLAFAKQKVKQVENDVGIHQAPSKPAPPQVPVNTYAGRPAIATPPTFVRTVQQQAAATPIQRAPAAPAPSPIKVVKNIVTSTINTGKNAVDVANAGRQGVQGLVPIAAAAIKHNPVAENNAINKTQAAMNYSLNASRGAYTPAEADSKNFKTAVLKPVARNVVTYAPYALGGVGSAEAALAPTLEGKAVGIGLNTAQNYGTNTLLNVANQKLQGQKVDVKTAAKESIVPTLVGGLIDGAHVAIKSPAVSEAAGSTKIAAKQAAMKLVDNKVPLNEVGAVGKNVNKLTPKQADDLWQTKYADRAASLNQQSNDLHQQAKVAPAAVKPILQAKAATVDKLAAIHENNFLTEAGHPELATPQVATAAATPAGKAAAYFANKPQATSDYQAHTMQEFGTTKPNVVSADSAKFIVDGGTKMKAANSAPYHEAASAFAKDYYKQLLDDPTTKDQPVLITGGGAGAGKTSGLSVLKEKGASLDNYAAINDTNLTTLKSATDRIDPALASGRKVDIVYTYRHPVEAFKNGNLPRAERTGRIVPISAHAETHIGSLQTIQQLAEKYKDNPNVTLNVVDNSRGRNNATLVPEGVDFLKNKVYSKSKLTKDLQNELEQAKANSTIQPATYSAYRESDSGEPQQENPQGNLATGSPKNVRSNSRQPSQENSLEELLPSAGDIAKKRVADLGKQRSNGNAPTPPAGVRTKNGGKSGNVVENRLTTGGKEGRQNLSPAVQAEISGEHAVRSTKQLAANAAAGADGQSLDHIIQKAHEDLAVPAGHIDDTTVASVQQAIERADAEGRTQDAVALHDALSEHLVKQGQTIQAASLLYKLSPNGQLYKGLRDIKKAGGEITPELEGKLKGLTDNINNAKTPEEKDFATAQLHKAVADAIPQSAANNALSVWKASLLSGVKTQGGNFVSNATFGGLKKVSDVVSAEVDNALSLFTGQRTKTLTNRGTFEGTVQGLKSAKTTMKTGIDVRNAGDKYEQHADINFKNPVIQKVFGMPANFIFRGMNAADQPFYYSAFKNSIYDQAKAEGLTMKLRGDALNDYMNKTAAEPSEQMAETAKREADKSVLNYDTVGSKAIQAMHTGIDHVPGITPAGKAIAHVALNVLAPFVRVPSAFLSRTIDFTPLGVGKEIFHQIAAKKFDQRALSTAIGEGATGTGVIALGIALTQNNLLSGDYPTGDPKEVQRWKAEGITPNSVKLGGKWISLNYLGPVGLLFNAGHNIETSVGGSAATKVSAALAGFGQGLLNQSFLQGFSGFSAAINNPTQSAKTYINSEAGSIVPAISNDVANATDKFQRQANTVGQTIKNRIPGLREQNPIKQDIYGNKLQQPSGITGVINPLKPSNVLANPVTTEVARLHNVDPNNSDLQVTPTPIKSVLTVDSTPVHLSNTQQYALQTQVGQSIQKYWGQLIQTPKYQALNDVDKAKALTDLRTDVTSATERDFITQNGLATYTKAATKAEAAILNGSVDPTSYATKASGVKAPKATAATKAKTTKTTTTKAKTTTTKTAKVKAAAKPKFITTGFKTAGSTKAPKLPAGVKIKKLAAPKFSVGKATTKKLAVHKIPSNYLTRKLA